MSAVTVPAGFVLVPEEFLDFLRHAPVSSGTCCCGDDMEKHSDPMSCGHSPVDMWDHELDQWLKEIAARPAITAGTDAGAVDALGFEPGEYPDEVKSRAYIAACGVLGKGDYPSYDQTCEVADQMMKLIAALKTRVIVALDGIDRDEIEDPSGWWETSTGAKFGRSVLEKVRAEFDALTPDTAEAVPVEAQPGEVVREALAKIEAAIKLGMDASDSDGGDDDLSPFRDAFGAVDVIRAALASVPAPAGEAVERVEVVTDIPSSIAVKIMQLDWTRGGTDDEHADRYGQLQDLLLVELNMAGFEALAEATRLREDAASWRRVAERCKTEAETMKTERDTVLSQLDDVRREISTAREDALDTLYERAKDRWPDAAFWLRDMGILLLEIEPMLPADRAALRASHAGSPTDGE